MSSSHSSVAQIHILGSTTEILTLNFVVICLLTFENETWWLDRSQGAVQTVGLSGVGLQSILKLPRPDFSGSTGLSVLLRGN